LQLAIASTRNWVLLSAVISDTATFVSAGLASGYRYSFTAFVARFTVTMRARGTGFAEPSRPGVLSADCMMPTSVESSGVMVRPSIP